MFVLVKKRKEKKEFIINSFDLECTCVLTWLLWARTSPWEAFLCLCLLWSNSKTPTEIHLFSTLSILVVWQHFIFSKEKDLSLCLKFLGYALFLHTKFSLETTKYLGSYYLHETLGITDLPIAFPVWSKSQPDGTLFKSFY